MVLDYIGFTMVSSSMVLQGFLTHLTRLNFIVGLSTGLMGAIMGLT